MKRRDDACPLATLPMSQQCSSTSVGLPQEQRRVHTTGDHKTCLHSRPNFHHKLTIHPQISPEISSNMSVINSRMTSGIKQNHTISLITPRHLTLHSSLWYSNNLTASRQLPNFTLVCWPSLSTFSFILDLADDQVIDHTIHYHVADLDSWLGYPV